MRFRVALILVVGLAGPAAGQNLLTNGGFEAGTLPPWVQMGGGGVNQGQFGIVPTQGTWCWNLVRSFESGGTGVFEGVYQTVTLAPSDYTLTVDVQAHNRTDGFVYVAGQPSSQPEHTAVVLGYDLTGGTNPDAGTVVRTAPINTGAQWQRINVPIVKTTASSPVTIFLLTESRFNYSGNWAGFDRARLTDDAACSNPSTITDVSPSSYNVPPALGSSELLTIDGTQLDLVNAVQLVGPANMTGVIQTQTPSQITATFDLSNAPVGTYSMVATRTAPCENATRTNAVTINCACPTTTVTGVSNGQGLSGNTAHTIRILGTNVTCLSGVKLRKTNNSTGQEIIGTNLTPVGGELEVTFDLTGLEGGRWNVIPTHPCNQVVPSSGLPGAFLVYMPALTNASFEEGFQSDPTTGSVCLDPGANGNRPKARHWDQNATAATGLGGHKRDGNFHFPECVNGEIKNITGTHYNGFDLITDGTNPLNTVSFFQTIAAPHVDGNGISTTPYNVRAEFAINGGSPAYPVTAEIRLLDGTEQDTHNIITTTAIPSKFEQEGDSGLVADPDYNAIVPAGRLYQSDPPILTIEFRFTSSGSSPPGSPYGFWVDNVRTGPFAGPGCNIMWADADGDGDVDHDDFAVFQLCYTGPAGGIPAQPAYCSCMDREPPFGVINDQDLVAFTNCVSGPEVPWSPAVAPSCNP